MYFLSELCCQHLRYSYSRRVVRITLDMVGKRIATWMSWGRFLSFSVGQCLCPSNPASHWEIMLLLKALCAFAEFLYMLPAWALTVSLCNSDTHLAVQHAEPFSARTHVSDFMAWHARRRSGLPHHQPATRNLSSPSKCGTQGTCLQTVLALWPQRQHLVPLHRERKKKEQFQTLQWVHI